MKFIVALLLYDFMWTVCKQVWSVCGRVSELLEYTPLFMTAGDSRYVVRGSHTNKITKCYLHRS